jgi:hypothetical protein
MANIILHPFKKVKRSKKLRFLNHKATVKTTVKVKILDFQGFGGFLYGFTVKCKCIEKIGFLTAKSVPID